MTIGVRELHQSMIDVRNARRKIVEALVSGQKHFNEELTTLRKRATEFQLGIGRNDKHKLQFESGESIEVFPSYLGQIHKDLVFLKEGNPNLSVFFQWLSEEDPSFEEEVEGAFQNLSSNRYDVLISDRDGTLEPYSPFYATAIQSIYSAWTLYQFGAAQKREVVLLTSGPLKDLGIVDVNVDLKGTLTYAGSKARQVLTRTNRLVEMSLPPEQAKVLHTFETELKRLLTQEENRKFTLTGSGLQQKYGELAIARNTTPPIFSESESETFKAEVVALVQKVDASGKILDLHDTGSDLEILLRTQQQKAGFSKGDGLQWINETLELQLEEASGLLIAGDTLSDVPMLAKAKELNPHTRILFKTTEEKLAQKVQSIDPQAGIVSSEDALLAVLHKLSN